MKSKSILLVVVVLFLCAWPALGTIEFKDGLIHDIDYKIEDDVYVDYQTPDMYTTVNLLDGGSLNTHSSLCGYEHSRINILGGSMHHLKSYDSSQVNISDSELYDLYSHDYSKINILGGSIRHLYSYDSSQVNVSISSGFMNNLNSYNSSQVNVSSGSITTLKTYDSSQADISGGSIGWLKSYGSSQVNISGGEIEERIDSHDFSQVNISGDRIDKLVSYDSSQVNISDGYIRDLRSLGCSRVDISDGWITQLSGSESSQINISGGRIFSIGSTTQINISGAEMIYNIQLGARGNVKIFGTDFAIDGQPVVFGELTSIYGGSTLDEPWRNLTGTLLSGEFLDTDFRIGNDAKIILIPEPATILLLGLGGLFLKRRN